MPVFQVSLGGTFQEERRFWNSPHKAEEMRRVTVGSSLDDLTYLHGPQAYGQKGY